MTLPVDRAFLAAVAEPEHCARRARVMLVFMWEEDPRYQHANLWLAVFELGIVTLAFAAWSAWKHDWIYLGGWLLVLAVILMAVLGYGAVVWLVCRAAFVGRLIRRKGRRASDED